MMDQLFGDQSHTTDEWFDSSDGNESQQSVDQMNSEWKPKKMKTTIEKVLNVSPIRKKSNEDINEDITYGSVYDFESDLSFDKSKSSRKYSSGQKSMHFSPVMRSTPKPSKSRNLRYAKNRKKSYKNSSIGLWDKAIDKNPHLRQWIDSFNEDMKKLESLELSTTQSNDLSID